MADEREVAGVNAGTGTILKVIFGLVSAAILLFGGYHGLNSYVDNKIQKRVDNPEYIQKLARSVRPSLLFDEGGSIVADMGAVSLVKKISVTKDYEEGLEIVITPHGYLAVEPVLESLDGRYMIQVERGEMFVWKYHLHLYDNRISEVTMRSSSMRSGLPAPTAGAGLRSGLQPGRQRFRLEIIQ
ncbi:MAG: hypothetical protein ACI8ZB_002655 [Desulforhopalus sp.]|jgi:hypothetical protein